MSIRPLRAVDVVLDDAPVTCLHEFTARRDYLLDVDGRRHGQPLPGTGGCGFRNGDRCNLLRLAGMGTGATWLSACAAGPREIGVHEISGRTSLQLRVTLRAEDQQLGYRAAQRGWESASGKQLYLKKRTACVRSPFLIFLCISLRPLPFPFYHSALL